MPLSRPEPLAETHELSDFFSDVGSLDDRPKRRVRANQVSGTLRTLIVAVDRKVVAHNALASGAIAVASSVSRFRRNVPDPIRRWCSAGLRSIVRCKVGGSVARSFAITRRGSPWRKRSGRSRWDVKCRPNATTSASPRARIASAWPMLREAPMTKAVFPESVVMSKRGGGGTLRRATLL